MKTLPLFCTGFSFLLGCALYAQQPPPAPAPAPADKEGINLKDASEEPKVKLDDTVKKANVPDVAPETPRTRELPGLEKLTQDQKKSLVAGMGEVSNYLRGVRLLESLEKLNEMESALGVSNHYIENLRGAVYTKMKDYKRARVHFRKALEFAKDFEAEAFHPRFNLAELDFVEKQWDPARDAFQKLLADPGKPTSGSDSLIKFKILICDLQQKKEVEAEEVMKTFDKYDAESPAFYFGNAVKLFIKNDKEGANEWLESARRIYPKEINEVYNDSLVEMGWLETLQ